MEIDFLKKHHNLREEGEEKLSINKIIADNLPDETVYKIDDIFI